MKSYKTMLSPLKGPKQMNPYPEPLVLKIWNSYYRYDPTNFGQLKRKFFNNVYLNPIEPVTLGNAYSLMCIRAKKFLYAPEEKDKAWIVSAAMSSEGALEKLLAKQIDIVKKLGIHCIYYSNFSPGYFFPGVEKEKYPEVYDALISVGFTEESTALAMDADIGQCEYVEHDDNIAPISCLREEEVPKFLEFVENNFPADCFLRASGVINEGSLEQITVAKVSNEFAGYAMYAAGEGPSEYTPGERFGCFEVKEEFRSIGIGSRLLAHTLNEMKANAIRHAYFMWTSERASHLYLKYGFKITRSFSIMRLEV